MRREANPGGGGEAGDTPSPVEMTPILTRQLLLLRSTRQKLELVMESARFADQSAEIAQLNERLDCIEQRLRTRS